MSFELIGSHVLDGICAKVDEIKQYICITTDNADDKINLVDELEQIQHMIKSNRVACDIQPMQKVVDDNHPEEDEYQPCEEEIHAFEEQ